MKIDVDYKDFLTPLEAVGLVKKNAKSLAEQRSKSLVEFTKAARVEPIVLMDQRAMALPYVTDVMESLSSIFSGYYLQAMALSVDSVDGVDTVKALDKLNPRRDPVGTWYGAMQDVDLNSLDAVSVESNAYELPRQFGNVSNEARSNREAIEEASNLSVGKLLEVKVGHSKNSAIIPVMVRLIVAGMSPKTMVHTLAVGQTPRSAKERWHAWRAGQIEFVRDLLLCQDLMRKHRKDLLEDPSGYYAAATSRDRKNQLAALGSGNASVATASAMFVITEQTRIELESAIGGKLDDFKTREKVFEETYGMIMVVIDPEWEQVTIYHQSIDTPTELSVRDIKQANGGSGPDVFEILKAYQLGQSPSI